MKQVVKNVSARLFILALCLFSVQLKADILLEEDFSGGVLPTGWSTSIEQGSHSWLVRNTPAFQSTSGGYYVVFDDEILLPGTTPNESVLDLPIIDCTGRTSVKLRFEHHWFGVEDTHGTIEISTNGTVWNTIADYEQISQGTTTTPAEEIFDISLLAANQSELRVRFRYDDGGQAGRYWYLDDIIVYADPDVGVTDLLVPDHLGCNDTYSANEAVVVEVTNFSFEEVSNVPVVVEVSNGITAVLTTTVVGPIAGQSSVNITLPVTVDMTTDAVYDFNCYTDLLGDTYIANDSHYGSRQQLVTTYPYHQDFNGTEGGWWAHGSHPPNHWNRRFLHGQFTYLGGPDGEEDSWYTYASGTTAAAWVWVESPVFDLSGLSDPQISFDVKHALDGVSVYHVQWSTNGVNWYTLGDDEADWYNDPPWWRSSQTNPVDTWTRVHHSLCDVVGQTCVKFRVRGRPYQGDNVAPGTSNFAFDNVTIEDGPDVGITAFVDPFNEGCLFSQDQEVTISVSNYGCGPVVNLPVSCEVSGAAATILGGIVPGPIAAESSEDFTFAGTFDMTGIGIYNFDAEVSMPGDIYPANDQLLESIDVSTLKVTSYPYLEDFNSGTGYWSNSGTDPPDNNNRNFYHGPIPYLGGDDGEFDSWYVLADEQDNHTWIWVESPVFDFSEVTQPTLTMDIKHRLHAADVFQVRYSIDGGSNWLQLGVGTDPNWYNSGSYWSNSQASPVSDWTSVTQDLCHLSGEPCVIFRVYGRPLYGNDTYDYFAFDNFAIDAGVADDIEAREIRLPDGGDCSAFGANETVSVIVQNHACRALYNIPVQYVVDGGAPVVEVIPGPVGAFGTKIFTFSTTADLSAPGTHTIEVTTMLPTDGVASNNSVSRTRINTPGISTFPYLEDFNDDNGGWASQTPTSVRYFHYGELPYLDAPGPEGNCIYMQSHTNVYSNWVSIESPVFDFTDLTEPQISFDVKYQLKNGSLFKVDWSTDGGANWTHLGSYRPNWYNAGLYWNNNESEPVDDWTLVHHSVCNLAGNPCVKFRISSRPLYGEPAHETGSRFAIDNFRIEDGPDVAVTEYVGPVDVGCLFSTDEQVTVEVSNFGCIPVNDVPISCVVTGPVASVLNGVVPGPIPAGGSVNFTFPTGFNMTTMGSYQFSTTVSMPGDIFADNDNLTTEIDVTTLKVTDFPYLEDFNSGTGFWNIGGTHPPNNNNRNFHYGEFDYLDGPEGEEESWYVVADGQANDTWIWLESPVFDFSELTRPVLTMQLKHQLQNADVFRMQYSIDGGNNWQTLGDHTDPNWYNSSGNWWTGSINSPVHDWTTVTQEMCELSGEECVIFRLYGRPLYGHDQWDYFAMDNFQISAGELDELETKELILSDAGNCSGFSTEEQVSVILRNNNCRPLTNVPIQLQVDGGPIINELVPGPINPFSNYHFVFNTTVDLSDPGTHSIMVNTVLTTDSDLTNNQLTRTRLAEPISTFPYLEDFNLDNGGWASRLVSTATRFFHYDTVPYLNGSQGEGRSWHIETNTSTNGGYVYLESPVFDFSTLSSPQISFDLKHSLHNIDIFKVDVSTNGGSNWTTLGLDEPNWYNTVGWWRDSQADPVDEWTTVQHNLCNYAGLSCVKFRIYGRPYYGAPTFPERGMFAIDNVSIEESIDVGAVSQVSPIDDGCLFSDSESITVEVFNYISSGCAPIFNVPVTVEVSGPISQTFSGVVPGPIPVGGSAEFTFTGTVDMTALGTYHFKTYTQHPLDLNLDNDTLYHSIEVIQHIVSTFPYVEDFNSHDGNWIAQGGNNRDFVYGMLPYLNGSDEECWYVVADGFHGGQWISLESPVFDFTDVENPRLHFDIKHQLNNADIFRMEYSLDGGNNWSLMPQGPLPNWYTTQYYWTGTQNTPIDEWRPQYMDLCDHAGESCVKYRFYGRPIFGDDTRDHFAIDNFRITDTEIDAQIVSVEGCYGSEYGIDVTFRNLNELCEIPANITSITVGYELDGAPPVEQVFNGLNVPANSTATLTLTGITVPDQLSDLTVWVKEPNSITDQLYENDTLSPDLNLWPQCNDHCSNSIELHFGTTTASQTSNATIEPAEDPSFAGCGAITVENTVWYHFSTNGIGGDVQVEFHDLACTPSNNGIQVSILEINGTACDPASYTEVFCTSPQNLNDFVFGPMELPANTTYYIGVDGFAGNDCDFLITIAGAVSSVDVDAPTSSDHAGCTGPFDLTASGSTGNYIWYDSFIGGTQLSTANPYTVSPTSTTTYYVCAVDGIGTESNRIPVTVTLTDTEDPVALCQDITVSLDAAGNATITAADVDNGSSDDCNLVDLVVTPSTFSCDDVGANTVTLKAIDGFGNSGTCLATVTVVDDIPPVAACENITVELNAAGIANIGPGDVEEGSTDNCNLDDRTVSPDSFDCDDLGANNVTVTVWDEAGNSSTCNAIVTVLDNAPPTAVCQNITVTLDATGNASIDASDVDGGSTDNCGIASMTATPNTFGCGDVGAQSVILTVTDAAGNASSCEAIVTVQDDEPPTAVCVNIEVSLDATGSVSISPGVVGSGSSDNCGINGGGLSQDSFDCDDLGPNNVTLSMYDGQGNTSSCTAVVTVVDDSDPIVLCQNITIGLDASGNASINPEDVDAGSTDNCGIVSLVVSPNMFTCSDVGANTVTLTAMDASGNSASCNAVVTVNGISDPRVWNGSIDTDWHTDGNWSCGGVPNQSVNVLIPNVAGVSGNFPVVSATGYAKDLTIDPSANVQLLEGSTLEIAGNWTNNGWAGLGDGTVVFNGSIPQNINGTNEFGGLRLDNALGLAVVAGTQQINIKLELETGDLATNGLLFIINSDENRTAYVNDFSPGYIGTATGDVTVERHISNDFQAYHYIGSPVDGAVISDWSDDFVTDAWEGSSDGQQIIPTVDCVPDYLDGASPFGRLFDYRESTVGDCYLDGWHVRTNGPLTNGLGFAAMLPDLTNLDVTGPATTGDVTIGGLTNTNNVGNGFNLVSNPFPSNLHWTGVVSHPANAGFDATAYLWNATGQYAGTYQLLNPILPQPELSSSQSFFIRLSNPGTGTFTLPQSARVAGDQPFVRQSASDVERLSLSFSGSQGADLTHVFLSDQFTAEYDNTADAKKLIGLQNVPSISTDFGEDNFAALALSTNDLPERIPLSIYAPIEGEYNFSVNHLSPFFGEVTVYLEDRLYNELSELRNGVSISKFIYEDDDDRFALVFKNSTRIDEFTISEAQIFVSGNLLKIRSANEPFDQVTLRDASGRSIITQNLDGTVEHSLDMLPYSSGVYVVELSGKSRSERKKITWIR